MHVRPGDVGLPPARLPDCLTRRRSPPYKDHGGRAIAYGSAYFPGYFTMQRSAGSWRFDYRSRVPGASVNHSR